MLRQAARAAIAGRHLPSIPYERMGFTSESVEALVEQFAKLPGVGRKTAQRLASHVLKTPRAEIADLAHTLIKVKDTVRQCSVCCNITDADPCAICLSPERDHALICVVEDANDVLAIERLGEYRGVYHVLGGAISPLDGVGPEDLRIHELLQRIHPEQAASAPAQNGQTPARKEAVHAAEAPREIIFALNPTVEGDTTVYYLSQLLKPSEVRLTRIARGLPIGGDLEYADEATLARALEGRDAL